MNTIEQLLSHCGSYFRSLCKIRPWGDGSFWAELPTGIQFDLCWEPNRGFGFAPVLSGNGETEQPKIWLTFEEATTILKAYSQAWERANPEGGWQEEWTQDVMAMGYASFTCHIGIYAEKAQYCPWSVTDERGVFIGEGGGENEDDAIRKARTALYNHLASLKGGGK